MLAGAAVAAAPGAAQGLPRGTAAQQTSPRVLPVTVRRRTAVRVIFTLADAPGHQGIFETAYRVQVDRPKGSRAACAAPAPPPVTGGARGERTRVALPGPRYGWCLGRYHVTVFEQRGPYCPQPAPGAMPQPCPLFASQDLDVGRAGFTVRR